ncbi:hypothetical protein [Streptomyces nigrescens]|uniref:hypothetical protein n=1 Tax=Streptomyces nigrescens TaxID=1920 RepID=UPI003701DB23
MSASSQLTEALNDFRKAKKAIEGTFDASGAPEIVSAVLSRSLPRSGTCSNGFEYSVHGIDSPPTEGKFTWMAADKAIASPFTTGTSLETSSRFEEMDVEEIERECSLMTEQGVVRKIRTGVYLLI